MLNRVHCNYPRAETWASVCLTLVTVSSERSDLWVPTTSSLSCENNAAILEHFGSSPLERLTVLRCSFDLRLSFLLHAAWLIQKKPTLIRPQQHVLIWLRLILPHYTNIKIPTIKTCGVEPQIPQWLSRDLSHSGSSPTTLTGRRKELRMEGDGRVFPTTSRWVCLS